MAPKQYKRLGDMLIEAGLITPKDLEGAIAEQKRSGSMLGATLVRMGFVKEHQVLELLQQQLGLSLVDLSEVAIDESTIARVREDLARKYSAIPVEVQGRNLVVAMADPLNVAALEDLRFHTGLNIRPVLAATIQINEAIERYYNADKSMKEVIDNIINTEEEVIVNRVTEEEQAGTAEEMQEAEGRPIVRLTNWILQGAIEARASDIHIEPQDKDVAVRYRIDGMLQEQQRLPKRTQSALVSRIKVLSNMDIAEKRHPQDGRLRAEISDRRVELRISTLPVAHGEKVVMRVVDHARSIVSLADIGFYPEDLDRLRRFLDRPQGIVLVTGPTGSGKSTLLYSALRHIQHGNQEHRDRRGPRRAPAARHQSGPGRREGEEDLSPTALRAILRQDRTSS